MQDHGLCANCLAVFSLSYTAIKVRFPTLLCLRKCVGNITLQNKFQKVYMKFGSFNIHFLI